MSEDPRFFALIGAIFGAKLSAAASYFIFRRNRAQNYYFGLAKIISDHNRMIVKEGLPDGLTIAVADPKVSIVCYQHLNLLFYPWLHRDTIGSDGSMQGWENWAAAKVNGARSAQNEQCRVAYFEILRHGDLYSAAFKAWLQRTLGLSVKAFAPKDSVQN